VDIKPFKHHTVLFTAERGHSPGMHFTMEAHLSLLISLTTKRFGTVI